MLTAYVDESMRRRPDDASVYAMAAVILDSSHHTPVRTTLESLRAGKSPRLHWRDESPARRTAIARELARLTIRGLVTICLFDTGSRTERARRRCLERLLIELNSAEVMTATIESRSPEQDHLDRGLLTGLRLAGTVPKHLEISWQSSLEEPLLWAADAIVSAATWWLDGDTSYFETLAEQVHTICLE